MYSEGDTMAGRKVGLQFRKPLYDLQYHDQA